jgi:hypothetical protein
MIPCLTERTNTNESKEIFNQPCGGHVQMHYGRQQTRTLRTPTVLESEPPRLRDKTINGMIRPSLFLGHGSPRSLRDSFGEELHAACMTATISGPRYGSTVGTSLAISANFSVWATRLNFAYEANTRRPSNYSPAGRNNSTHPKQAPTNNPDNFFSSWEYFPKLRVLPSEHDNATLGAVRKQCQASPALLAFCPELQTTGKGSGHDSVNSPAPDHSNQRHPHYL